MGSPGHPQRRADTAAASSLGVCKALLLPPPFAQHRLTKARNRLAALQIAGGSEFSLDVATTVLRCFQLQPTTANKELIAKTLLRALMQLPRPDYKICIHLLPEKLVVG